MSGYADEDGLDIGETVWVVSVQEHGVVAARGGDEFVVLKFRDEEFVSAVRDDLLWCEPWQSSRARAQFYGVKPADVDRIFGPEPKRLGKGQIPGPSLSGRQI